MVLAYALYKPRQKKLFTRASLRYAIGVSVWFIIFTCLLVIPAVKNISVNYTVLPLLIFVSIIWFLSPTLVRIFGHEPPKGLSQAPARLLIAFESRVYLTKYFEILFQQSIFVYILFILLYGMSVPGTLIWFTVIIGIIHLGNLPFTGKKDTLYYLYLSLPMAVLFGYLILRGYVFVTISLHMLFYLVFNGRHWFRFNKSINRRK